MWQMIKGHSSSLSLIACWPLCYKSQSHHGGGVYRSIVYPLIGLFFQMRRWVGIKRIDFITKCDKSVYYEVRHWRTVAIFDICTRLRRKALETSCVMSKNVLDFTTEIIWTASCCDGWDWAGGRKKNWLRVAVMLGLRRKGKKHARKWRRYPWLLGFREINWKTGTMSKSGSPLVSAIVE